MRLVPLLLLAAAPLAAAPLAAQTTSAPAGAQGPAGGMAGMSHADPDKMVNGGLRVTGWAARFDRPAAKPEQVSFTRMGAGYHVVAGPAAVYYPERSAPASGGAGSSGAMVSAETGARPAAHARTRSAHVASASSS